MTGAQTQPVHVPRHVRASAILLKIASLIFEKVRQGDGPDQAEDHWAFVRSLQHAISQRGHVILHPSECERWQRAADFAHFLAHEHDSAPARIEPIEYCSCALSDDCLEFASLMAAEAALAAAATANAVQRKGRRRDGGNHKNLCHA